MKPTLVFLLLIAATAADAQPIYRCINSAGQLAFQDVPCAEPPAAAARPPAAQVHVAYSDESGYTQGGWTNQQRWQRRREAKLEWRAEALRVGQLLQPASDLKAASYASSNQRCHQALQIAALCGTASRPFSCDAKGFHYDPSAETSAPGISGAVDHQSAFQRQQCALQMTRGR